MVLGTKHTSIHSNSLLKNVHREREGRQFIGGGGIVKSLFLESYGARFLFKVRHAQETLVVLLGGGSIILFIGYVSVNVIAFKKLNTQNLLQ